VFLLAEVRHEEAAADAAALRVVDPGAQNGGDGPVYR